MKTPNTVEQTDRRYRFVRIVLTLAIVAAVFSGLAAIQMNTEPYDQTETDAFPPLRVNTLTVIEEHGYSVSRHYLGAVEAKRDSHIGFELGGMITEISANEGDFVHTGDVVARLDTALLGAERETLLNVQKEAKAFLDLAVISRKRLAEALALSVVSTQEWDEADQAFNARSAALEQVGSAIAMVDVKLRKSDLVAPFDAIVAKRYVDEGEVLGAGLPVLELIERADPEARIGVAGSSVDTLEVGQQHELSIRNRVVRGVISSILPTRDGTTRGVDVILTLDAAFGPIRQGDLARLTIKESVPAKGVWLPLTALTESSRGLWACYAVTPRAQGDSGQLGSHVLRPRQLQIIHHGDGQVFVRGTLNAGDIVVSDGLHRLVPDQGVRISKVELPVLAESDYE